MKPKTQTKPRRGPKLPTFIYADYADRQWAFYTSKRDQRSNRPDLKPIRVRIERA